MCFSCFSLFWFHTVELLALTGHCCDNLKKPSTYTNVQTINFFCYFILSNMCNWFMPSRANHARWFEMNTCLIWYFTMITSCTIDWFPKYNNAKFFEHYYLIWTCFDKLRNFELFIDTENVRRMFREYPLWLRVSWTPPLTSTPKP